MSSERDQLRATQIAVDPDPRASVLLRLLVAALVALGAATVPLAATQPDLALLVGMAVVPVGAAALLTCRGAVDAPAWLAALSVVAVVVAVALTRTQAPVALVWMVLPVLSASLVMRQLQVGILALLTLVASIVLALLEPAGLDASIYVLALLLAVLVLAMGLNHLLWDKLWRPAFDALPNSQSDTGERDRQALITDLVEAKRAHQVLATLVRASPAAVVVLDSNLRVLLWNPAAETLFGWRSYEVLDKRCPLFMGAIKPLGGIQDDVRLETKEGLERRVLISSSPLFGTGTVSGWVAVIIDVSEQQALREHLERDRQREALSILARGVAHSFNNSLAIIEGSAQELLAQIQERHHREQLRHILEASREAAHVSRRLLDLGQPDAGEGRRVEVSHVVTQQAQLLSSSLDPSYRVEVSTTPTPAMVQVDPVHLQQIITDLALCARDAMPHGGTMELSVSLDASAREVIIEVRDESTAPRGRLAGPVFDPRRGHGLGLSVAWSLVTAAGGQLEVEHEDDMGTTARVRLPQAQPEVPTTREPNAPPRGQGERVLLIDDDPRILEVVRYQLSRLGYAVDTAADLDEAVRAFQAHPPDLVLADVSMPGTSGPLCVQHLRTLGRFSVVFMTGLVDRGSVVEDIPLLQKPFTLNQLATELRRTLGAPTTPLSVKRRKKMEATPADA